MSQRRFTDLHKPPCCETLFDLETAQVRALSGIRVLQPVIEFQFTARWFETRSSDSKHVRVLQNSTNRQC